MTWREVTVWEWMCDRCGHETQADDDATPVGWLTTEMGNALCPTCVLVTAGA